MDVRRTLPFLIISITLVSLLVHAYAMAADDNRVALVVDYGDGEVATRCVSFPEETISGYEALQRSDLPFETEIQAGGAAVCSIDGRGCPADDCFCSCPGGVDCVYWSYWHQIEGEWRYSVGGSGLYRVSDGAVEGWVWGPGSVTQAPPPPAVSFSEICSGEPTAMADFNAQVTTPDDSLPEGPDRPNYLGFAGLVLALLALGLYMVIRRRSLAGGPGQ